MKKWIFPGLAAFSLLMLTTAFINGPAKRGFDKTGSPVSSGSCMDCHSNVNYSPSLNIKMFDGDLEVNSYEPGKLYTLKYQLFNTGSPAAFGLQTTVLDAKNDFAGTFGAPPSGFQKSTFKDVDYIEHASPRPLSSFQIDWTAPENANEVITVYGGSVAVNGNNSTSGDGGDVDALVLQPATSDLDNPRRPSEKLFSLSSNLVKDHLDIRFITDQELILFYLMNQQGQIVRQWIENPILSGQSVRMDLGSLTPGFYILSGSNLDLRTTEKLVIN